MNESISKKESFLRAALRLMAFLVLKKYNPKIVSITGSVGKTSTKEAIFTVLASRFRARRSEKNYNNEIGLPLTIIGAESGKRSLREWIKVFFKWLIVILLPIEYPEILVLEMGADRPGDIDYLTGFVRSDAAVVTDVSLSHIEFFKTLEKVAEEKMSLAKSLSENSLAVINADNQYILKLKDQIKARVIGIGLSEKADMYATDVSFNYSSGSEIKGLSFKLNYKGTTLPVRLNNILARHQIYPALAAVAVGIEFGINLVDSTAALMNFSVPCSRLNLISGIKNSKIIDDTYNASPASVKAALEVLGDIKAERKIAALGDMLELGGESEKSHREIAKKFLETGGDIFFAVGERMKFAAEELQGSDFPKENIFSFPSPLEAAKKIQEAMKEGDLVLVKGSQGMRMEKIVEEIMAEPQKAGELLCRQNQEWREKPWRAV